MVRTGFVVLVTLTVMAADAAAQAPVQSFSDLSSLVEPGQRVIVREDDGRTSRGRVVSLVNDQLEIAWRRWLFQRAYRAGRTTMAASACGRRAASSCAPRRRTMTVQSGSSSGSSVTGRARSGR